MKHPSVTIDQAIETLLAAKAKIGGDKCLILSMSLPWRAA